jgi:putative hydrolase of HD superfamily
MKNNLEKIFDFLKISGNLKNVYRYGDVEILNDESTADHSWRLALVAMIFIKELNLKINTEHALKLAIIHDLPESITGDITANRTMVDSKLRKEKEKNEIKAINRLKNLLPEIQGSEIHKLWHDYEYSKTKEAKFIKALDKIEAYINWIEAGYKYIVKCGGPHLVAIYPDEAVKDFPKLIPTLRILKQKMKKEFKKGGIEWKKEYENI